MFTKYPEAILAYQLAYQLTIIKASQQYDGLYLHGYDTHNRVNAVTPYTFCWPMLFGLPVRGLQF